MDAAAAVLMIKALDGLSMRASATAENIANAATTGYRPLRVSFEQALKAASQSGPSALAAIRPQLERESGPDAQGLRLDLELATASSTAMRYSALVEVLGRELQIDSLAMSGNG